MAAPSRRDRAELRTPPAFASFDDFRERTGDVDFWWPHVAEVLRRHGLLETSREPEPGFNPTNPTFVCGDVVVKLFGVGHWWRKGFEAERAAHNRLATDPEIAAPRMLAHGMLFDGTDEPWAYLVTSRMPGVALPEADLSREQMAAMAEAFGRQVRRLHALPPTGVATHAEWPALGVREAAARSSLPPHLVAQVDGFVSRAGLFDEVVVHGDLCGMHVFVEDGRFSGIIDWGDAMVTDRHYEIIQPFRDSGMFRCDRDLLRIFLEASGWPVDDDFPRKAMIHALFRQAIGMTQHHSIDVFMEVAELFPLDDIATLDELARELFTV